LKGKEKKKGKEKEKEIGNVEMVMFRKK
jgi:hypothetical protein